MDGYISFDLLGRISANEVQVVCWMNYYGRRIRYITHQSKTAKGEKMYVK